MTSAADAMIFEVSLTTVELQARALAARLGEALDMDVISVSLFEVEGAMWRVAVHSAEAHAVAATRALIAGFAGEDAAAALVVEAVPRRDWVAASLAGLSPVRAGRFFVYGAHDRSKVPANAVAVELEAALAFGTGHHGTTRGCLLALDGLLRAHSPRRTLDLGTGTGVLAIAAAKSTRRAVLASDIDRRAVEIARANARANGVGPRVATIQADGPRGRRFIRRGGYDLILANILLEPLRRLCVPLARLTRPGGHVILSGLLHAQANAALAPYRSQGFVLLRRLDLEGWTTLVLARPRVNRKKPRSV